MPTPTHARWSHTVSYVLKLMRHSDGHGNTLRALVPQTTARDGPARRRTARRPRGAGSTWPRRPAKIVLRIQAHHSAPLSSRPSPQAALKLYSRSDRVIRDGPMALRVRNAKSETQISLWTGQQRVQRHLRLAPLRCHALELRHRLRESPELPECLCANAPHRQPNRQIRDERLLLRGKHGAQSAVLSKKRTRTACTPCESLSAAPSVLQLGCKGFGTECLVAPFRVSISWPRLKDIPPRLRGLWGTVLSTGTRSYERR